MSVTGTDLQEAVDAPRFHQQWLQEVMNLEPDAISPETRKTLEGWGQKFCQPQEANHVAAILVGAPKLSGKAVDRNRCYGADDTRRNSGLVQRSAAVAKEIKTWIDGSANNVDGGTKQVDQAGATMNEIVTAVKRVTDIMAEIAAASGEQSAGIEEVNHAITRMDGVTQQNAALVEEAAAAAAAESMHGQAEAWMDAVGMFKLETGRTMSSVAVARPAIAYRTPHHAPAVPARKERQLVKVKAGRNEDWKEF